MKSVIITGGNGFLGKHLVSILESEWTVHVVGRSGTNFSKKIVSHQADILVPGEVERLIEELSPSHFIHLAWYSKHNTYWESSENKKWAERSAILFEKFFSNGGKAAIGIGSCAEYDWLKPSPYEETMPTLPLSQYGKSKNDLRQFLESKANWNVSWARLFFLYGPHEQQERFVPYCFRNLLAGTPPSLGSPNKKRDYLYVKDAALGLKALLEGSRFGTYNLASGQSTSVGEMAQTMERVLGISGKIIFDKNRTFPVQSEDLVADISKIRSTFGWQPQYSLSEGLQETLEWWKKNENHH